MGKTGGLTNYFIVCEHNTKKKKRSTKKEKEKKGLMIVRSLEEGLLFLLANGKHR